MLQGVLLSLLVAHVALSVANQFRRFQDALGGIGRWLVLPNWSFFAPLPGTHDHRVVYRDRGRDGTLSGWSEVCMHHRRRLTHVVWNPDKHLLKCLSDCTSGLARRLEASNVETKGLIKLCWPYLKIAGLVERQPALLPREARQFALLLTSGGHERRTLVLFVSDWHRA